MRRAFFQLVVKGLLKSSMSEQGFRDLSEEWWHYTLVDEPYPDTDFDVPVR